MSDTEPKRTAAVVKAEFHYMLDQAHINGWADKLKCHLKEKVFSLYRRTPSPADAAALCEGCPMLKLCDEYAQKTKPGHGIWGGKVWVLGRALRPNSVEKKIAS